MNTTFKRVSALAIAILFSMIPAQLFAEWGESVRTGLVNWYMFNEWTGTAAADSQAPSADATLMNGASWSTDVSSSISWNTNSIAFDGTNDHVITSNSPDLPTGDFSYTAWIKPTSGATTFLMASDGSGGNELRIDRTVANKIQLWIDVSTQITSIGTITLDSWSHVAVTRSGSTISIYINGVLDSTATFGTVLGFGSCPLMIGVDVDSSCAGGLSDHWEGNIDDVRVYSAALTPGEIEQIAWVMVGTAGFTLTPATDVTMDEGETRTNAFSVVLDGQPTTDVVIDVTSTDVTANTSTLTFTNSNWNVSQDVSITTPEDPDAQDEDNGTVTFAINSSLSDDLFDAVSNQTRFLDTTDNDTPGITVTNIDTLTSECGDAGSVSVVLDTLPTDDVTVNVSSSDTVEGGTVAPVSVTFDGTNLWNVPQTITITGTSADQSLCSSAADGLVDTVEYNINFSVTSVDLDYDAFSIAPITMTNQDMDPPALLVNSVDPATSESGDTAEVEICAVGDPGAGTVITIPVSLSDGTEGSLSASDIIITTDGTSTQDCASVSVTGLDDLILDGDVAYSLVTGDPASLDPSFDALIDTNVADASLTNLDDETAGFTLSTDITIPEGETTAIAYTVSLTAEPLSDVVVNVTSDLTVNTPVLTFTPSNWNVGQNISLTAPEDANAHSEQDVYVTLTVDDALSADGFDGTTASAYVDVIDDETAGFSVTSATDIILYEGNTLAETYSVVLTAEPRSNVVVTVSETSDAVAANTPTLTFTSANWNVPQIISLTATEDAGDVSEPSVAITFAIDDTLSDDDFDILSDEIKSVFVYDNDISGGGSSSSTPRTEDKKTTKSITVGTKREPVTTAPKAATVTSGAEETSQTTNTATSIIAPNTTLVLNAGPETKTTTPTTVGTKITLPIETSVVPRDAKKVFKYVFEDADIVTKLGLTKSQYETQCSSKNGVNYYRTCKLGTGLKSFIDYRDDVVCEGFISKKADDASYKMERTAVRSEVVATAVKMKRIDGKSVAIVPASAYTDTFKDLAGQPAWIPGVAETALKYGIVTPKDHFSPSREVTRAEAYALFAKSVCLSYPAVTSKDASWQKNLYEQVKVAGLSARSWENFKPGRPVLRQEMFVIASQMADWAERTGGCTPKPEACFLSVTK